MRLSECCSIKHGFAFKGTDITNEPGQYVLVTPGNFRIGGGFQFADKQKYYVGSIPADYVLAPGDLIVTMTDLSRNVDTLGYSAIVPYDSLTYLHNQRIGLVSVDDGLVDKGFLYWLLRTRHYQRTIAGRATGSTVKHTSPTLILEYDFDFPEMTTQIAIASFLDSLEKAMAVNARTNDYLADLLDARFDNLIEIESSDWDTASLLDIASYKNGLAMQRFRPVGDDAGLPVLKIRELGQGYCGNDAERCRSDIDESVTIHDGDLVFSWSGTLLLDFWAGGDAGLNQHLFKVTSCAYPSWFYYMWTKRHMRRFIALAKDRATTMGHIKRSALQESEVLIPPVDVMTGLTAEMQPIVDEIIGLKVQSRKLGELRDALLPKLMSGEIDVSAISAEEFVV